MKVEGRTIAWENGGDIDPDVLYYNLTPAGRRQLKTQVAELREYMGALFRVLDLA